MQIAQTMGGYSLGAADLLRRAMGKKIRAEMDSQRQTFVDGATGRGIPQAKAVEVFEMMAKFADYGFNKSHAAAYALVAYQTAWMKMPTTRSSSWRRACRWRSTTPTSWPRCGRRRSGWASACCRRTSTAPAPISPSTPTRPASRRSAMRWRR